MRPGLILAGALIVALALSIPGGAGAQDEPEPTEPPVQVREAEPELPGSIPRPNTGSSPSDPGERGGWYQLGLLGLLIGAIGFIASRVFSGVRHTRSPGPTGRTSSAGGGLEGGTEPVDRLGGGRD